MKLNRIYTLSVQLNDGSYQKIESPMTLEFSIDRNTQASSNQASLKIYNLAEKTRSLLFQDRYQVPHRYVELYAGYEGGNLSLIFHGLMYVGYSQRRNADWMTSIEAFDTAINAYKATSSRSFVAGKQKKAVIKELYKDFEGVGAGVVGGFTETTKRPLVINGPTIKALDDLTENNFFFDNGVPIAMKKGEYFKNDVFTTLEATTGILNSPLKSSAQITVPLVFTPELQVGQKVSVNAKEKQYNGEYKVVGIKHSGIISGTHNAQTITTASLFNGAPMVEISRG
jgi:hypothetical protein